MSKIVLLLSPYTGVAKPPRRAGRTDGLVAIYISALLINSGGVERVKSQASIRTR